MDGHLSVVSAIAMGSGSIPAPGGPSGLPVLFVFADGRTRPYNSGVAAQGGRQRIIVVGVLATLFLRRVTW